MIRRRDQWIPDLPNWERKRLEYRMQNATTPAAAWRHVIASIERDKVESRAHTKQSFLAAIEAETDGEIIIIAVNPRPSSIQGDGVEG